MNREFTANKPNRLDMAVIEQFVDITRSQAQSLIKQGCITVNGNECKPNYKLTAGDVVVVASKQQESLVILAQDIPIEIIYEDGDVAVVNKAAGMVVHPGSGNFDNTLVNALLFHMGKLSELGGEDRPGIVHRLDKDTSGLMMIAKTDVAHEYLSAQLKDKTAKRIYTAVVSGHFNTKSGKINACIGRHPKDRKKMAVVDGGREAVTHFKVLEEFKKTSLLECALETGRTHQIRVHMAYASHPVLGDMVYGNINRPDGIPRQALHAGRLEFIHPATNKPMRFEAPLPEDLEQVINTLRNS